MQDFTSERAKELVNNGFYFNRAYYIQRAIGLVKSNWQVLAAFTAIYLGTMFILLMNPSTIQIAQITQMILSGPISAGYYLSIKRIIEGEKLTLNNLFEGFQNFIPTMLVFMTVNLLTTLGLALYIIPAIFIATIYLFAMPLVVFTKISFWNAMESSRVIVMAKFWDILIFGIIIIGINLLGLLALGVGVLFTLPLSYALILVAYEDIYGFDDVEESKKSYDNDFSHFR